MDSPTSPLADRVRPQQIAQIVGQEHLLNPGKPLFQALTAAHIHSMILWGPPGSGKTTIARLLAKEKKWQFCPLSAVQSGVKELRMITAEASLRKQQYNQATILFIDEIHRYNKTQQDALLPFVEDGSVMLIGATTENPSFEVNNALLSRVRVYKLNPLSTRAVVQILHQAIDHQQGFRDLALTFEDEVIEIIAKSADGDARQALNLLDLCVSQAIHTKSAKLTKSILDNIASEDVRRFDKRGDQYFDQISAIHKAVRGSSPDGALYWYARMLDGGCDPLYIARRVVRMASEDIGNADPRGLSLALDAWDAQRRLGSPEGELAIAQAIVYLASTVKSNSVYSAFKQAQADAKHYGSLPVPVHLRNAPTQLMKKMGHGANYRYAHDDDDGYTAGQTYFPERMQERKYYHPVDRGIEQRIKQRLDQLKTKDLAYKQRAEPRSENSD